jgi:cation diffusion facilitator CzcD-associated flavoprotein CzcO
MQTLPTHVRALIVGAGFSGLGMAIKLDEAGVSDFLVVEKGPDVGGTWRDNSYPGAACDVPSQLYSYSFALNPEWTSAFSKQPEIQAYIRKVADDSGTLDRFAFETELQDARWDEASQRWIVRTSRGEVSAQFLIPGCGPLNEPKLPDIDGIETFQGEIFHSSRWNHDADLTGKRIAVIGTGASAIQIVPELQKVAGHLDVYQRTAPWVLPRNDRPYTGIEKTLFHKVPLVQKAYRAGIYATLEARVPAFTKVPAVMKPASAVARWNIMRGIKDPELRRKVTPDFTMGCKRILISNAYYPALDSDNVDLVTEGIDKVTGSSIVTKDGVEREIDVLVVATGFHTTDMPIAEHVTGREGRTLADVWAEQGMAAYKGTTVNGFPNLAFIIGPNVGLGHSSMVFMIESQVRYITDLVRTAADEGITALEPRQEAQDEWNADLQKRMKPTVWLTGGCASWYLDERGNNTTLWPRQTFSFRRLLSRFDRDAYVLHSPCSTESEKVSA